MSVASSRIRQFDGAAVNGPPWSLALVSRFWRHSPLSYHLWRYIEISYHKRASLEEINLQLISAADASLEIVFHGGSSGDRHRVLELMVQNCSRWRTVHLSGLFSERLVDMLNLTKGRLKRLEKLEVGGNWNSATVCGFFSDAPNLRTVFHTDRKHRSSSPPLVLPWTQVTHYRGRSTAERQLNILQMPPNLVECALYFEGDSWVPENDPLMLPSLRLLSVSLGDPLCHLVAPSLEELSLFTWLNYPTPIDAVLPFIQRSSCALTKLVLGCCTVSDALISLLRIFPSLTHLLLRPSAERGQVTAALVDALTISRSPSDLCPNLTSIQYGISGKIFDQDPLFAMARSRIHPNHHCPWPFSASLMR
ncbi:hypothetical protein B0H13DRAFT_720734 [Mycena leptocephala]|nr:hypothetical protein B0H13DRAFT_720734 [Mycena leptocephala]